MASSNLSRSGKEKSPVPSVSKKKLSPSTPAKQTRPSTTTGQYFPRTHTEEPLPLTPEVTRRDVAQRLAPRTPGQTTPIVITPGSTASSVSYSEDDIFDSSFN